jgi:cytochrome bd-type quinol oxidase subunit 2
VIEGNTDVKRLILSIAVILFAILSAVTLRGYVNGDQQGDPEYYILLFSLFCGAASAVCLWRLTKS